MKKWVKIIFLTLVLGVFAFSVIKIGSILIEYKKGNDLYENTADKFVTANPKVPGAPAKPDGPSDVGNAGDPGNDGTHGGEGHGGDTVEEQVELAPIVVDFASLRAINEDIEGWLYCEDTNINYPVLRGDNNDQYLRHSYEKKYLRNGSIFVECTNSGNFQDYNTIIYGHHMRNGSMFGKLDLWAEQDYFDGHCVFWLLTPEQDYKVELMSCYNTSAYSDTYTIFRGPSIELNDYIDKALEKSVVKSDTQPEEGARYVLFTTCAYIFDNARFVMHGKLVPVDSAGGVQIEK